MIQETEPQHARMTPHFAARIARALLKQNSIERTFEVELDDNEIDAVAVALRALGCTTEAQPFTDFVLVHTPAYAL